MTRLPNSRQQLKTHTRALLASLGDNPVQIASTLEALCVRATPHDRQGCAIAAFLHPLLAGESAIACIEVTATHVVLEASRPWHRRTRVKLSGPVRRFVNSFDAGLFPALVRSEPKGSTESPVRHGP
jgi:hypothetical protein